jgi:phosphinothricin acetyltransferase
MRQRITETLTCFPWVVYEHHEIVLGYAYAGKHRTRAAYQWSVDTSVYIHADARRCGIGRGLYTRKRGKGFREDKHRNCHDVAE